MIVAGDFNTWSPTRLAVVNDVMQRMGLVSVLPSNDTRSRFLGRQVDYIFVRGLDVVHAAAPEVGSSDHNPVLATLRVLDGSWAGANESGFATSSSPDRMLSSQ